MKNDIDDILDPYLTHLHGCVWDVQDDPYGCTCDLTKRELMIQTELDRLRNIERHWLSIAVRDPEPRLRKAIQTIDEMTIRATGLEKIIDTAETYIANEDLCTYYESLDQI